MSTPDGRIFSSWKEIAAFLGKGVRTVQRWERTLGLPVRRPNGTSSNVVVAAEEDLRRWMNQGQDHSLGRQAETNARDIRELEAEVARLEEAQARLEMALEKFELRFTKLENSLLGREGLEDAIVTPKEDGAIVPESDTEFEASGDEDISPEAA